MAMTMCKKDRDEKLNNLIPDSERFDCMIWATIMENTVDLVKKPWFLNSALGGAAGALTNQYCYMGISNKTLYISVIKTFKVTKESYNLAIPFAEIKDVKIKGTLIPKRKVLMLYFEDKKKMKIAVMSNAIGTDIKDQQENASKFFEIISKNFNTK